MKTNKVMALALSLAMCGAFLAAPACVQAEGESVYIGETPYANLDAALSAVNDNKTDNTIIISGDQTVTKTGYLVGYPYTTTIKSDSDTKRTITLSPTGSNANIFIWDGWSFENIRLTMADNASIQAVFPYQTTYYNNNTTTFTNCEITGITAGDCISVFGGNNLNNTSVTGNTATATLFSNRKDSIISGSIITGNTTSTLGTVEASIGTITINSSVIKDNSNSYGDVHLRKGAGVKLGGTTEIGILYTEGGTITLASDFVGSAAIKMSSGSVSIGDSIATIEDGASTAGITVENMPANSALSVVDGKLQVVSATSAAAEITEIKSFSGEEYGDTKATAVKFTVTPAMLNDNAQAIQAVSVTVQGAQEGTLTKTAADFGTIQGDAVFAILIANGLIDSDAITIHVQ